jgi:hypothetical protein
MTTIAFAPSNTSAPPFQTTVTLDGNTYGLSVAWNIAGQRWYCTLADQYGDLVYSAALAGSPPGYDIPMAPGMFQTSTLLYRSGTGNFEVSP